MSVNKNTFAGDERHVCNHSEQITAAVSDFESDMTAERKNTQTHDTHPKSFGGCPL